MGWLKQSEQWDRTARIRDKRVADSEKKGDKWLIAHDRKEAATARAQAAKYRRQGK